MGKAKTRGGGWGKRKRKRNRRPSSDLTLGKGRRADRRSPCFPGRKALLRVLWHLRPSSRRRRGRRGRAEGKGREGKEKGGYGWGGPREEGRAGRQATGVWPSTGSGPLAHCGSQPATAFVVSCPLWPFPSLLLQGKERRRWPWLDPR
jgi:hypothetical protein